MTNSKIAIQRVLLAGAFLFGAVTTCPALAAEDEEEKKGGWLEAIFGPDYSIMSERQTLSGAAENGMVLIAQDLLQRGVDVNTRDGFGRTPLIRAAQRGNTQMVRYLLDNKANLKLEDYSGFTALHWAVHENRAETVKYLLRRGADPSAKSSTKVSPVDVAQHKGYAHITTLFPTAGHNDTGSLTLDAPSFTQDVSSSTSVKNSVNPPSDKRLSKDLPATAQSAPKAATPGAADKNSLNDL